MITPLAIQLYQEYLTGKSVQELSQKFRLPFRCVQVRLRAATAFVSSRSSPPRDPRKRGPL
jgi:Mor family transcriptional regulator